MRHWNVEPDSLLVNAKLADVDVVELLAAGPDEIVVFGGVVSGAEIVQVCVAGEASTLPAPSVARTSNVCEPTPRPLYAFGDAHDAHAPPSMRHSNVDPDSLLANAKLADPDALGFDGPDEIVVSGGVVSAAAEIVQVCVAGEASTLPAASVARTSNVCDPAPRPL
jgi:hypothetical protein